MVFFCLLVVSCIRPGPARSADRTLFILLSGVSYDVVAELTDPGRGEQALFKEMKGPTALVTTFPSDTETALSGMLSTFGLAPSPGYEPRYFDLKQNRIRGGDPFFDCTHPSPWQRFFDWNPKGPFQHALDALHPINAGIVRIDAALNAFSKSEKNPFWIYLGATELAGHLKGPEAVKELLISLERKLRDIRKQKIEDPFNVVIFSDHGMGGGVPLINVRPWVRKALETSGYRHAGKLLGPEDVVLTPSALLSAFQVYTLENASVYVARTIAAVPGVDLCVFKSGQGWTIESQRGLAFFERRSTSEGLLWSYESPIGDPLNYKPLMDEICQEKTDGCEWIADKTWFDVSPNAEYPDAFHRLAAAFDLVENPATVLCSCSRGYMYGSSRAEWRFKLSGSRLRWTHGALNREASLGFLMSDRPDWDPPQAVRFDQALLPFSPER